MGRMAAILALLASGLPIFFFLVPTGGVTALEIVSVHLLLVGWLAIVGGLGAALAAWTSTLTGAVSGAVLMVAAWLVLPFAGREFFPGGAAAWGVLDSFNVLTLLDGMRLSVESRLGQAAMMVGAGGGLMALFCLAGGRVLQFRNERRRIRAASGPGLGRRFKNNVGSILHALAPRAMFRPLFPVRHPLMERECSLGRDGSFRMVWLGSVVLYLALITSGLRELGR